MGYETSIAGFDSGFDGVLTEHSEPKREAMSVEFGREPQVVPRVQLNAFFQAQARKTYDQDGIVDLAGSIENDELLHSLTVAELTPDDARRYVDGLNELWGAKYEADDVALNDNGNCYMLVAGHRRLLAIDHILKNSSQYDAYSTEEVAIQSNIFSDLSLTDALRLQIAENGHQGLPPHEDAYSIRMFYEESGLSLAQCARELGRSEEKVRLAVRFSELPQSVRATVEDGIISYTAATSLTPLAKAYEAQRDHEGERRYSEQEVEDMLLVVLGRYRKNEWSPGQLQNHIHGMIGELGFDQMEFEMVLEEGAASETATLRRGMAYALGETALKNLQLAVEHLDGDALEGERAQSLMQEIEATLTRYRIRHIREDENQPSFDLDA